MSRWALGPSSVGRTQNTSPGRHPGCMLTRCLNNLRWLLQMWRTSSSAPSSSYLQGKVQQPWKGKEFHTPFRHYQQLETIGEVRSRDQQVNKYRPVMVKVRTEQKGKALCPASLVTADAVLWEFYPFLTENHGLSCWSSSPLIHGVTESYRPLLDDASD